MSMLTDINAWITNTFLTFITSYRAFKEYKKAEKVDTVKAIYITSDYGIFGVNETIEGVVDNENDFCKLKGFDRIFFGDDKKGIIKYTASDGTKYIIISDGNHQSIDANKINKAEWKVKSKKVSDKTILDLKQADIENVQLKQKLDDMNIKDAGITVDLTLADDHIDKKDLGVLADKVMGHSFFKGLTSISNKTILMIFLLGGFFFIAAHDLFLILLFFLYEILKILIQG